MPLAPILGLPKCEASRATEGKEVTDMTDTIALSIPAHVYLQRLRALGAWWRLGSSALDPDLLIQYPTRRERSTVCEVAADCC